MAEKISYKKGTTLIETLVYIALLSTLIVGVFSSVYIIIASENNQPELQQSDNNLLLETYH